MIRNRDYIDKIRFIKTVEDLYIDSNSGLFTEMGRKSGGQFTHSNVPQFLVDNVFGLSTLDLSFGDKYSERFLNKTSANEYSIVNGEIVNPGNLSNLAQQTLDYFCKKWDNLYYLYYKIVIGDDYNPIENYSSFEKTTYNDLTDEKIHSGTDTETTTYNNVTDELTKSGTEKSAQKSEIKQKPLKTTRSILDEYGSLSGGTYVNGIKDTTNYNRNYTQTDTAGSTSGGSTVPFTTQDETKIAGFDSPDYSNSEKVIHTESGVRGSSGFIDAQGSGESTERTGKHTSISVDGGKMDSSGTVTEDAIQTVTEMNPQNNYSELSFANRTDSNVKSGSEDNEIEYDSSETNIRSGSFEVEKTGNIGVMTVADMIQKFIESDYIQTTFLNIVFQDIADFISLKCY